MNAPYNGMLADPAAFVVSAYESLAIRPIPEKDLRRVIQEFSYPGITHAVPRYYNATTMLQEWIARRDRLLSAWKCLVLVIQGFDSRTQPREFYERAQDHIPNAADVGVRIIPEGHFWGLENPEDTTSAIRELLTM